MVTAFYRHKPAPDAPYRELVLSLKHGFQVRLLGGTKWGIDNDAKELQSIPVKDFTEGIEVYDRLYRELHEQGWRAYSPYESW